MTKSLPSVSLFYTEGSSDKEYHAMIGMHETGGFDVLFRYGRRGSALMCGKKNPNPVSLAEAKIIFEKLIKDKKIKGYSPGEAGTPYAHTSKEERDSGLRPQLLNAASEPELETLLKSGDYGASQKHDGVRRMIRKSGDTIEGINRLGLTVPIPAPMAKEISFVEEDFIIDGEAVGDNFHAFDILQVGGVPTTKWPYSDRIGVLKKFIEKHHLAFVHVVPVMTTEPAKRKLLSRLQKENAEGIVLKDMQAEYKPGRPASGGPQWKFKFCETASFLVTAINQKRSVALGVYDGSELVGVGNVTVPPNHPVPKAGDVVECRYLYRFPKGAVAQPFLIGIRDDIPASECLESQLKLKKEEA